MPGVLMMRAEGSHLSISNAVLGEKVIPVKIPLRSIKRKSEPSLSVPIVQFEKTSQDVRFVAPQKAKEEQTEYSTTLKSPWMATKSEKKKQKEREKEDATNNKDSIELIASVKDVQSTLDFEALICYVSIGVSMTSELYGMDKELYTVALSMYLLKNGKWRIPKDAFKTSFRYPCIKYIYEKDLTTAFANGLKADLEKMTTSERASKHLSEQGDYIEFIIIYRFHYQHTISRASNLQCESIRNEVFKCNMSIGKQRNNRNQIQQAVSKSDVIGLIFLALLRNQFYTGAIQVVDTGFVCIRHILVGCQILQDASDDKRNEQIQRETSQRLKLDTFQQVHQESEFHWAQLQTDFLEEYSVKTIFPIHLQLLALPVCLVQFILWCTFPYFYSKVKGRCSKNDQDGDDNYMKNSFDSETDKLNDNPMFVRVFLYNANFDLRLQSTKEAEGIAALKSKGTMEVMEEDKISILQKQMAVQNRKFEKHHVRSNRKNDKLNSAFQFEFADVN
ncbi:unnamed protein product [Mytilus coruscus]|uniref:Uncharacterized protein n=1 Tax=Mytilus coruscus TaxID=42192 RepID=A0A6J8ELJ3_MYTCO|nr:unnamed protein product [Mytilus coruscus]